MARSISYGLLILLPIATSLAAPQSKKTEPRKGDSRKTSAGRTPLTSIEAVTDIDAPRDPDDPGAGGGIDGVGYFSRRLAPKVGACTAQIRTTPMNGRRVSISSPARAISGPAICLCILENPNSMAFSSLHIACASRKSGPASRYSFILPTGGDTIRW